MSNRGIIVADPHSRPKLIAETASFIPLLWPSLLSLDDISSAVSVGVFELDRVESTNRCAERVSLYANVFADFPNVPQFAESFISKLRSKKCKTIGLDISDLVPHEDGLIPPLHYAIEAIESGDAGYAVTIPAKTVDNPFSAETMDIPEQHYSSAKELLHTICSVGDHALNTSKNEELQGWFTGDILK